MEHARLREPVTSTRERNRQRPRVYRLMLELLLINRPFAVRFSLGLERHQQAATSRKFVEERGSIRCRGIRQQCHGEEIGCCHDEDEQFPGWLRTFRRAHRRRRGMLTYP